jgi:hypothetical protein
VLTLSGLSLVGLVSALGLGFLALATIVSVELHMGIALVAILLALITHMLGKEGEDMLAALLLLLVLASGLGTASDIFSGTTHMLIAILAILSSVWTHIRRLRAAWM